MEPDMQTHDRPAAPHGLPGEREWLRSALLTDQDGVLTATRGRLARLARARGMESQVIDDVIQEALLEAWGHLDRLRDPAGFNPWVDEICRNVCRRVNRSRRRDALCQAPAQRATGALDELATARQNDVLLDLPDPSRSDPFEELSRQDLASLLARALSALPPATRQAVELSYLADLPRAEVAARLGLSQGALDTRLHRARQQLRQALNGPLRAEAEAYGLALDDAATGQWQATRMWCPLCARRRLEGSFVRVDDARGPNLHLRCLECSRRDGRDGRDTAHSMGLVSLAGLRSFRPAWKRTMQGLSERITQALTDDAHSCLSCGKPALLTVRTAGSSAEPPPGAPPLYLHGLCGHCGVDIGADTCLPTVEQIVCWSDPRARQFLLRHPRCVSNLGPEFEREGVDALSFHLVDLDGADHLTVIAHRQTLRVLTVA
jgi:RNA polymerase sigma-70 factor (ECF subfamily)